MLVLQQFDCSARLCNQDGIVLSLSGGSIGGAFEPSKSPVLTAPILDPHGNSVAALELVMREQGTSESLCLLLGTVIRAAASALTERWFRIHYRHQWILLAVLLDAPDTAVLLALDRDHSVVGANATARQMTAVSGRNVTAGLSVRAFFRGGDDIPLSRRYCDKAVTLHGSINAKPWTVLTSPPASGVYSDTTEGAVLHARPRHDMLRCPEDVSPEAPEENGLPSRILRYIEDYIEAHLDSSLNVDELAASAGISTSHFSRCFRNSLGVAPHSYVMRRRLTRAQDLLVSTNMALSEVALSTGFSDQSHFSRRFHQFMGLPPRSFRLRHR